MTWVASHKIKNKNPVENVLVARVNEYEPECRIIVYK
jgi:hypothetical protein